MTDAKMLELMSAFRSAYSRADRAALLQVTTGDFEWHQHAATSTSEQPTGRVLKGIDALLNELQWRTDHWQDVIYSGLEERAAGDLLVQTFVIQGCEDGKSFHAKAVDLYPVVDGRIARKDTYWKYLK